MQTSRKVLTATFWYTISNFLLRGLAFITTPIFSRVLTKAEFGSFANYSTWYGLISIFATLSLSASLSRGRFDFKNDIHSFISSILILGSLFTSIVFAVIFLNSDFFSSLFVINRRYLIIMYVTMLVNPAYEMFLAMQRFEYKYKNVAILTIITSMTSIAISLVLIFTMKNHLMARVLGNAIPSFTVSVIAYVYYLRSVNAKYWRYSLIICVPYIFHLLSGSVLGQSDRAMITSICGTESTALYSMAYNVALVVNVLWMSMNNAFTPWLGEKLIASQHAAIKKYTKPYLSVFAILIMVLMLIAPEALLFLGGKQYLAAKEVIPPVMVGCYFIFVYSMYVNVEQFEKKTIGMAIATFSAAISNLFLNWLFIPLYGYIAAAYTTLFCYLLLCLFHYILVRQMGLSSIYDTRFIIIISVVVCLLMVLSLWLYNNNSLRYMILALYLIEILVLSYKKRLQLISILKSK